MRDKEYCDALDHVELQLGALSAALHAHHAEYHYTTTKLKDKLSKSESDLKNILADSEADERERDDSVAIDNNDQDWERGGGGMSEEDLVEELTTMFLQADVDGNGVLDKKEFKSLMLNADLGLSKQQIKLLYSQADLQDNASIQYREFIPACIGL